MNTALYYPHTSIESQALLKTALLLWDKLEYIVPGAWFQQPRPSEYTGEKKELAEALEIIGHPLVPSAQEQEQVHKNVQRLVRDGLPKKYLFKPSQENYLVYADKFGGATWDLLRNQQLVGDTVSFLRKGRAVTDYSLNPELGLMLMTLLAQVCAGNTAMKVTDATYASKAQGAYFTRLEGGDFGFSKPGHETLVVESFAPRLPTKGATLRQLIDARRNEDAFLRELRTKYREEVDKFLMRISGIVQGSRDYERVWDEFHSKMRTELDELDRILGREKLSFGMGLLEKVAPGVALAAATYVSTHDAWTAVKTGALAFGITGGFKLLGSIPATNDKRENLLRSKSAGWLYAVENPTKKVKRKRQTS